MTECDWLWLSVTGCDWVWLGVTGCDWVCLGVTECAWVWLSVSGCDWVCLGVTECSFSFAALTHLIHCDDADIVVWVDSDGFFVDCLIVTGCLGIPTVDIADRVSQIPNPTPYTVIMQTEYYGNELIMRKQKPDLENPNLHKCP